MAVNIERLNELTRISRERELTPEEQTERESLRREYIAAVKQSLEAQLSSLKVKDEEGNVHDYKDYVLSQKEKLLDEQEVEAEKTDEYEKEHE